MSVYKKQTLLAGLFWNFPFALALLYKDCSLSEIQTFITLDKIRNNKLLLHFHLSPVMFVLSLVLLFLDFS